MNDVKQKKLKYLAGSLAVVLCFVALWSFWSKRSVQPEVLKIGIPVYNLEDPYMKEMTEALEEALKDSFQDPALPLRYEILDARGREDQQSRQMNYLLNQDIDILVWNPVDPASVSSTLDQASKKGIGVILFNREPNGKDLDVGQQIWYVGSDGQLAGKLQGEMLMEAWNHQQETLDKNGNGKIDYLLAEGEPAHYDTIRRTNAFMERTSGALPMNLLADFSADWSRVRACEEMRLLEDSVVEQAEAVICNNDDMALGIYDFYKEKGMELPLILGMNDNEEVHELIQQGILYGTISLNQETQVEDILRIIEKLSKGEAVEQKIWYSVPQKFPLGNPREKV